jgi:hypothetical protein
MATTPEAAKRRWKRVPKEERRRLLAPATQGWIKRTEERKLAKAIERVKAAGYEVKEAS